MKKSLFFGIVLLSFFAAAGLCYAGNKDRVIKNSLFSVTMPENLNGIYSAKVKKDEIMLYDKSSQKAGFGGFAFGIKAYKNPSDHAFIIGSKKIGELTDKNGVLYDMVIIKPTDVQHDYTKYPEAPQSYQSLYDLGENANIQGAKGAEYFKNQGMKGEDLYKGILKEHISVIKNKLNSTELEKKNMSYMYNTIAQGKTNVLDKIGYIYYDVNGDGIEELFIGEITNNNNKGVIYDIYTMVDRKPLHVISGGSRNRFYVCDESFLCNEYSSGAGESGINVTFLEENSTELFPQVSFKYDIYKNKNKPWFITYGTNADSDKWENVDEQTFNTRKKNFSRYMRFDFIPLSKVQF